MARVKRGVVARNKHKKVLKQAKGYYGARRKVYRVAKQAVIKAGQYSYRDRRARKRQFRPLWIVRLNAAARQWPRRPGASWANYRGGRPVRAARFMIVAAGRVACPSESHRWKRLIKF